MFPTTKMVLSQFEANNNDSVYASAIPKIPYRLKQNWDPEVFFHATMGSSDEMRDCHNITRYKLFENYK